MAKSLKVNVQVDRWPSSLAGKALIGVRLSAAIRGEDASPAEPDDAGSVTPWTWDAQPEDDGSAPDTTFPHGKHHWRIWRIRQGVANLVEVTAGAVLALAEEPDLDPALGTRLTELATEVVKEVGARVALEEPSEGELTGRTVFGLVDGLAALPHPVPAGLAVWTAFHIPDDEDGDRYIAAPRFKCDLADARTPAPPTDAHTSDLFVASYAPATVKAYITPSPPSGVQAELKADQLINVGEMSIRPPQKPAADAAAPPPAKVTLRDDAVDLPNRLAELIDPWPHILAVLDRAASEWLQPQAGDGLDETLAGVRRKALRRDLETRTKDAARPTLTWLLDTVAWPRLHRRAFVTATGVSPAVSLLQHGWVSGRPGGAALSVLADILDADDAAAAVKAAPVWFSSVAPERLAALVDLAPDLDDDDEEPGTPPTSAVEPGRRRITSLETDPGLRDWLALHWSAGAYDALKASPSQPARKLRAGDSRISLRLPGLGVAGASKLPVEDPALDKVLLDIASLRRAGGASVPVGIEGAAGGRLRVHVRSAGKAVAKFVLKLTPAEASLGIDGGGSQSAAWKGQRLIGQLSFKVTAGQVSVTFALRWAGPDGELKVEAPAVALSRDALKDGFDLETKAEAEDFTDVRYGAGPGEQAAVRAWLAARRDAPSAVRAAIALGMASPFLKQLAEGDAGQDDLPMRLRGKVEDFLKEQYQELEDAALALVTPAPEMAGLFKAIMAAAKAAALDRLPGLFADGDEAPRTTARAAPIVMQIDQFQGMPGSEDLWRRLSGVGVLVGRSSDGVTPSKWWSANAAELCAPKSKDGRREDLDPTAGAGGNGVKVKVFADHPYRVDPVPLQIAETAGVRAANLSYENRSLVAEMPGEAGLATDDDKAPGDGPASRRVEAYAFPIGGGRGSKLPKLTFGRHYHFLPYVIGLGGVLPVLLRQGDDPTIPKLTANASFDLDIDATTKPLVRDVHYLRTTPVGAPRLADKPPGVPEGVAPLAAELPIRPPPVTLRQDHPTWFFRDPRDAGGVLSFGGVIPGVSRLVRIELPVLPAAGDLVIRLVDPGNPLDKALLTATVKAADHAGKGLRLDASGTKAVLLATDPTVWAEDEPTSARIGVALDCKDTDTWKNFAVTITLEGAATGDIEPPTVLMGLRAASALSDDGATWEESRGLTRQLPPETAHQGRATVLLDGFRTPTGGAPTSVTLRFRPPAVDFWTFDRWVNSGPHAALIDKAHEHTTSIDPGRAVDRSLDDPAVEKTLVELVEVFPEVRTIGAVYLNHAFSLWPNAGQATLEVKTKPGAAASLTADTARLESGKLYELRAYAVIPAVQATLIDIPTAARLSPAVLEGLRAKDGKLLGQPLVLTFEVATDAIGTADEWFRSGLLDVSRVIRPEPVLEGATIGPSRGDRAIMKLCGVGTSQPPGDPQPLYPAIRYVDRMSLYCQRWGWRGRPLGDDITTVDLPPEGIQGWTEIGGDAERIAFAGRRDDDVGAIAERRLTKAHVYAGRARLTDPPALKSAPNLFERDLDYRLGSNLWRFGMKATCRYMALRPSSKLERYTHRHPEHPSAWQAQLLSDRPKGRTLRRPGLALVLPLTEPLMAAGAVPPLLALMNETSFANFNIGEGMEAVIDVGRHPFPDAGKPKFLQQWGPDPIRTGRGAPEGAVALRLDGPIGYTFDAETEAGRFDHSGWLASPVGARAEPWSMVRLRFRRWEEPRFLDQQPAQSPLRGLDGLVEEPPQVLVAAGGDAAGLPAGGGPPGGGGPRPEDEPKRPRLSLPISGDAPCGKPIYQLTSEGPTAKPATAGSPFAFNTQYEGLSLDLGQVPRAGEVGVTVAFLKEAVDDLGGLEFLKVSATIAEDDDGARLVIEARSSLGFSSPLKLPIGRDAGVELRLVVSAREPPELGKEAYQPAGDVSVRVRITRRDGQDSLERPEEGRWLSAACLPLMAGPKQKFMPGEILTVGVGHHAAPSGALMRPIRLSAFTLPVWCQFAEAMSTVTATLTDGTSLPMEVEGLAATIAADGITFGLQDGRALSKVTALGLTDADAQVEEVLLAVATVYRTDAFARLRERPVFVGEVPAAAVKVPLDKWLWRDDLLIASLTAAGGRGRVRLMRMLRLKASVGGRGPETLKQTLFGATPIEELGAPMSMNPPDTTGMLLGVSRPIEWAR